MVLVLLLLLVLMTDWLMLVVGDLPQLGQAALPSMLGLARGQKVALPLALRAPFLVHRASNLAEQRGQHRGERKWAAGGAQI